MGGRGGSPNAGRRDSTGPAATAPAAPAAPVAPQNLDDRIQNLILQLEKRPGQFISIVRIREGLPDVERSTLDATLRRLDDARIIQLEAEPNPHTLPVKARDQGIRIGGRDQHLVARVKY